MSLAEDKFFRSYLQRLDTLNTSFPVFLNFGSEKGKYSQRKLRIIFKIMHRSPIDATHAHVYGQTKRPVLLVNSFSEIVKQK